MTAARDLDEIIGMLVTLVVVLLAIAVIIIAIASRSPVGRRLRQQDRPRRLVLVHERRSHDPLRPLCTPAQRLPPHGPAAGSSGRAAARPAAAV